MLATPVTKYKSITAGRSSIRELLERLVDLPQVELDRPLVLLLLLTTGMQITWHLVDFKLQISDENSTMTSRRLTGHSSCPRPATSVGVDRKLKVTDLILLTSDLVGRD